MPKNRIKYFHVFECGLDRVYRCFTKSNIVLFSLLQNHITNIKYLNGDQTSKLKEGISVSFQYKKFYDIELDVLDLKKESNRSTCTHKITKIAQIPGLTILITIEFFWSSCDKKTYFLLTFELSDDFFTELLSMEFSNKDFEAICTNANSHLKIYFEELKIEELCIINVPLLEIYNFIKDWKLLLEAGKGYFKIKAAYQGEPDMYGSKMEIYSLDGLLYTSFLVKDFFISDTYVKINFECDDNKKRMFPIYDKTIFLVKLSESVTIVSISYYFKEFPEKDFYEIIAGFSKKFLKFIRSYFSKKTNQIEAKS